MCCVIISFLPVGIYTTCCQLGVTVCQLTLERNLEGGGQAWNVFKLKNERMFGWNVNFRCDVPSQVLCEDSFFTRELGKACRENDFTFGIYQTKKLNPMFMLCTKFQICTFCSALREAVLLYCYANQEGGGRGLIHSNALWHLHTTVDILNNNNKSDLKILSKISVFQELQS